MNVSSWLVLTNDCTEFELAITTAKVLNLRSLLLFLIYQLIRFFFRNSGMIVFFQCRLAELFILVSDSLSSFIFLVLNFSQRVTYLYVVKDLKLLKTLLYMQ